ncbi:MAG TPA: YitT family protein [Candidatus Caccousia avistercoris]|nr:YitT family protein [Candidatus Caccousia avistercoris]
MIVEKGCVILFTLVKPKRCAMALAGSAILAFGLYNVHALSGVTEGGILGMTLLLNHWFRISPAVSSVVMNAICYVVGWRLLGREFIVYSILAGGGFSVFYAVFEQFPPLWPQLAQYPWAAAVVGAVFVGVGVGLSVRAGGAPGGDDALAMVISHVTHWRIQWAYLLTDLVVLALSVSYIPLERLACSLLTVMLSGQVIGLVQRAGRSRKKEEARAEAEEA